MWTWRLAVAGGALATAICVGGLTTRTEAAKPDETATVAFVDMGKIGDEVKKTETWRRMSQQAEAERLKLQEEIETLKITRYLTAAEKTEMEGLRTKQKPSDEEKARLAVLQKKSDEVGKEFETLAQKVTPSAEEKKRREDLTLMVTSGDEKLRAEIINRQQQLRNTQVELLTKLQDQILKTVADAAKDTKVGLVVEQQSVLYGGRDLTDSVIKKLPK